jgi:23S rRNA (cytosine1962-C5)-methyltransferase
MKRPLLKLKPGKEKALANLHPWVFSGAFAQLPDNLEPGTEVALCSHDNKLLALGHFCNNAGLSVRLCSFDINQSLDKTFWKHKFQNALKLRRALGLPNNLTTGFRLIHGEGDGLSGLVCDIFGTSASLSLTNAGLKTIIPDLSDFLRANLAIKDIIFEETSNTQAEFLENNLKFIAHIGQGQKTGHFLDQRDNRNLVRSYAHGRHVLDAFCYSGGFSVYALAGGAAHLTSLDISSKACVQVQEHVRLNNLKNNTIIQHDCFDYIRSIKSGDFNFIILDPPAFAKNKSSILKASRGYKDINFYALKALARESLLFTFSCSQHISPDLFKKIIFAAAKDSGRDVKILHELTQSPDHPVSVYCPQSSYLKGLALYVA